MGTAEDQDWLDVELGFITEEERITRAYQRIFRDMLRKSYFSRVRPASPPSQETAS